MESIQNIERRKRKEKQTQVVTRTRRSRRKDVIEGDRK
jgi:hypothetical protein